MVSGSSRARAVITSGHAHARDLMCRELTFLSPSDPIEGMGRILEEHGIDTLPVVDRTGRLVGALVRGDLPGSRGRDVAREPARSKVRDWMRAAVTVGPKASLRLLCQVL